MVKMVKVEVRTVKLGEIKLNPDNPRTISKKDMDLLVKSLKDFPEMLELREIVVDEGMTILGGNMRYLALQKSGVKEATVKIVTGLTPAQKREFIVKDNAAFGDWNMEDLANSWADLPLADWGVDLPEDWLGGDKGEPADAEPQIDKAEELNKIWRVTLGDLWQIGEHRLLCGDSTKKEDVGRVMGGELGQMIFTDPPYGVAYNGGAKKRKELKGDHVGTEIYALALPLIATHVDKQSALYLWYADGHAAAAAAAAAAAGYCITAQIIWAKNNAQFVTSAHYKGKHEPCYYAHKKGQSARWHGPNNEVTLWEYDRANSNDFHPTQKPVELSLRAIKNSTEAGQIVVDAFGGSGSTMVSCENLGRKCRMIELDPLYVSVILQRMTDAFPGIEIRRIE
jgi:site-specific DNA-methyltransferase (adenine-specific)